MTQPWIVRLRSLLIPLTVLSASLGAQFMLMKWGKRTSEIEWSECPIFILKKESVRPLTFLCFAWKWVLFPFIIGFGWWFLAHLPYTNSIPTLIPFFHCIQNTVVKRKRVSILLFCPAFRSSQLNMHYVYFSWLKMNKRLPYAGFNWWANEMKRTL